jgi:hypothetical protein
MYGLVVEEKSEREREGERERERPSLAAKKELDLPSQTRNTNEGMKEGRNEYIGATRLLPFIPNPQKPSAEFRYCPIDVSM